MGMDARNLPLVGAPQQQAIVVEMPDGKKFQFPCVSVAYIGATPVDAILSQLVQMTSATTTAMIFAELERRGIIQPQTVEVKADPEPPAEVVSEPGKEEGKPMHLHVKKGGKK